MYKDNEDCVEKENDPEHMVIYPTSVMYYKCQIFLFFHRSQWRLPSGDVPEECIPHAVMRGKIMGMAPAGILNDERWVILFGDVCCKRDISLSDRKYCALHC